MIDFGWNRDDLGRPIPDYRDTEPGTYGDGPDPDADG